MSSHVESQRPTEATHGVTMRRFGVLFAVGLPGILASAAWLATPTGGSAGTDAGLTALIVVSVIVQYAVLLAIAVVIGLSRAPQLGLRSHLLERVSEGSPIVPKLRAELPTAAGLGVAAGVAILLAEAAFAPALPAGAGETEATVGAVLSGLPVRFLWDGLTEELLLRWGFVSLVASGLWKPVGHDTDRPSDRLLATAVVVTALVVGVGHLLLTAGTYDVLTSAIVGWVIAENTIGGLTYGWLFWQRSLEAAMIGHMATHVVFVAVSLVKVVV